jgi:transposase InsO family protein
MQSILRALVSLLLFRFRSRASLELEVIALRHQLSILQRRHRGVKKLPIPDRYFWAWLYRIWPRALDVMVLVKPDTVIDWHRKGFRMYWRWLSRNKPRGYSTSRELRNLIRDISRANPLWGCNRIQGELLKLGFDVSNTTVWRYMCPRRSPSPSPSWSVFIRNHMRDIVAIDMFVVITAGFRMLYAVIVLGHDRRRIIHFGVTDRPNQNWLVQQVSKAFERNTLPRYLVRDRDAAYGSRFNARMRALGIRQLITAPQSPWQNVYVERVIQSIRHECLNHVIIFNERHLRRILSSYVKYYNRTRTHLSLQQDCPESRRVEPPTAGKIVAIPEVGGLHHRYERRAA